MIPDADIVALSTSVSNHWSRKSTALIVINWTWLYLSWSDKAWKRRPRKARSIRPRGLSDVGSGGVMLRMGFTKRPISIMAFPYSSYASASTFEWRATSRRVFAWSFTRQR